MQQSTTTPMHSARAIAAEALRTYGIIDVANREHVLDERLDAVETLAALDRACDKLSLAEIDWYRHTPDHADLQSPDLQRLSAASTAYLSMRKQRDGLTIDAAGGGMTGASFAQWLCRFASIPRRPGCQAYVLGGVGHARSRPLRGSPHRDRPQRCFRQGEQAGRVAHQRLGTARNGQPAR